MGAIRWALQWMAHFLRGVDTMAKKENKRNPWYALLFLGYAGIMLYFLFFRTRTFTEGLGYWEQIWENCNLIPWKTVGNYWDVLVRPEYYTAKFGSAGAYRFQAAAALINILGNIAMFVPYGAFLPEMWRNLQKGWKVFFTGTLSIVAVEICQLLTFCGRFDIDDVILNVIGIMMGYGLWRLAHRTPKKKKA